VSVVRVDHLVLSVADVERSLRFYVDELGLQPERVDEWRREEVFFPSVRIDENTIIDLFGLPPAGAGDAPAVSRNVDHICLVVAPTAVSASTPFRPLRLSQVEHLQPGHESEERPKPAEERSA
jgi:catechol 2,3-dioxygenase-like lactoylglutathione lyase family enzyme